MGHTKGHLALGYQRILTVVNGRKMSIQVECCFLTMHESVWCRSSTGNGIQLSLIVLSFRHGGFGGNVQHHLLYHVHWQGGCLFFLLVHSFWLPLVVVVVDVEVMMVWDNRLSNLGNCYCWALVIGSIPPFSPIGLIGISTGNRFHSSKVSSIYFSRA